MTARGALTVRLGSHPPVRVPHIDRPGLWLPLGQCADFLDLHVTDLGEGRIGLCPEPDRCVPVPDEAIDRAAAPSIDIAILAPALGLAIARDADGRRAAVVPGAVADPSRPPDTAGDLLLPDVWTDAPLSLAERGRRSCVFAWASW